MEWLQVPDTILVSIDDFIYAFLSFLFSSLLSSPLLFFYLFLFFSFKDFICTRQQSIRVSTVSLSLSCFLSHFLSVLKVHVTSKIYMHLGYISIFIYYFSFQMGRFKKMLAARITISFSSSHFSRRTLSFFLSFYLSFSLIV